MTLCPIALVAGCKKCPAFKVCPLKSVIGDAPKASAAEAKKPAAANTKTRKLAEKKPAAKKPASRKK